MDRQNDFKKFSALWLAAMETYTKKASVIQIKLAFDVLSRFTLEEVALATKSYLGNPDGGRFAPKPADIVREIVGGGAQDRAMLAWSRVERSIRGIGPWASVTCDDPYILATIRDMGGWIKVCNCPTERDLIFLGKDFIARYGAYLSRGVAASDTPTYLAGSTEHAMSISGNSDDIAPPVTMLGESAPHSAAPRRLGNFAEGHSQLPRPKGRSLR